MELSGLLNMVGICNTDPLKTLSNQASYILLGKVLNFPPLDVKCKISIMRTCKTDVVGQKFTSKEWSNLGELEPLAKILGSKTTFAKQ